MPVVFFTAMSGMLLSPFASLRMNEIVESEAAAAVIIDSDVTQLIVGYMPFVQYRIP